MVSLKDGVEELQKVLGIGQQQWLLGAGVSFKSNIPLMYPLTERVKAMLDAPDGALLLELMNDLEPSCHIEHALSQLGDLLAIAERSRSKSAKVGTTSCTVAVLTKLYESIIAAVAQTIRFGYCAPNRGVGEVIGTPHAPIVEVEAHRKFVHQLFKGRANLEERSRISFATTNYDTLLEDALALERRACADGFAGGGISYWSGENIFDVTTLPGRMHRLLKLHGSVDWFNDKDHDVLRVRYGVKYLADLSRTLIYPQATKYVETQKDPFAKIFGSFRRSLMDAESNVLVIIGYSFGDKHINAEIESALRNRGNKTIVIAFSQEITDPAVAGATKLCTTLERWRSSSFGTRVYAATDKGIYIGSKHYPALTGTPLSWWTFAGVTDFLETGVAA